MLTYVSYTIIAVVIASMFFDRWREWREETRWRRDFSREFGKFVDAVKQDQEARP